MLVFVVVDDKETGSAIAQHHTQNTSWETGTSRQVCLLWQAPREFNLHTNIHLAARAPRATVTSRNDIIYSKSRSGLAAGEVQARGNYFEDMGVSRRKANSNILIQTSTVCLNFEKKNIPKNVLLRSWTKTRFGFHFVNCGIKRSVESSLNVSKVSHKKCVPV